MKKILLLLVVIVVLSGTITGCNSSQNDKKDRDISTSINNSEPSTPSLSSNITVRNLEELEEMREMIESAGEEEFEQYLRTVECSFSTTRENIIDFVKLVDSIPFVKIIEGNITKITREIGQTIDTGEYVDVLHIVTEADNGDWVRIEYILSANTAEKITEEMNSLSSSSIISKPVKTSDGRMTVYAETKRNTTSGPGDLVVWTADIDGIFAWVFFYNDNADTANTFDFFDSLNVSDFSSK